jgi:hypothetical protein
LVIFRSVSVHFTLVSWISQTDWKLVYASWDSTIAIEVSQQLTRWLFHEKPRYFVLHIANIIWLVWSLAR